MTRAVHPARGARAFTGVASAVVLVSMVAGYELSAQAAETAKLPSVVRGHSAVVPKTAVAAPPAPATAAPAATAPTQSAQAPAAAAPAAAAPAAAPAQAPVSAPVAVAPAPAPAPAPVTPPVATSSGSKH
jgi:hypothetical protein